MIWIAMMFILAIGATGGLLLGSNLRAYTDPHHGMMLMGAAGKGRRPPGALFGLRKGAPLTRYAATGAMRGIQLRKGRTKASQGAAIIPFERATMTPVPTEIQKSCGCGGV